MTVGKTVALLVLLAAIAAIAWQRVVGPADDAATAPSVEAAIEPAAPAESAADRLAQGAVSAELPAAGETRSYTVDASQSELYWRIYRAGAAANLGHNHTISAESFDGSVVLTSDLAEAEWDLSFAVADLIIDDPDLRARHGEDFESVPSEDDKAGTKENMLTDRVLDGEAYPTIRIEGNGVDGTPADARLPVTVEMLGRSIELEFPAALDIGTETIVVTGEHRVTHEELGMEPFSVFGGLMAVGEEIDFSYRIHAVAGD